MTLHKINLTLFIVYILAMTTLMITQGIGITPDRYAFILIFPILLLHKTRKFLLDWLPFLFLLISYDFFRGLAGTINPNVNYFGPINLEKALFGGQVPTIVLQKLFYTPGTIHWYDFLFAILYFLHFALPLAFAFLLWLKNRSYFKQFISSIITLSYAAFLTYVIYPASPPWLSSDLGYTEKIYKIMNVTLQYFPEKLSLPTIYHDLNPNLVAAIPSLHAAYPLLVFLYALKFYKKKALFFLPYVFGIWIAVVYLGEHYVIDVILGALYASIFYFTPKLALKLRYKFRQKFQPHLALESS